jgi:uncharacterized protein (DUF58 family)
VGFVAHGQHRELIQPDRGERQLTKILETLAVVNASGQVPFAQLLAAEMEHLPRHTTLLAITPSTDSAWVAAMRAIRRRGINGLAVLLAANTFGAAPPYAETLAELLASAIPTHLVANGQDIPIALSQRVTSLDALTDALSRRLEDGKPNGA